MFLTLLHPIILGAALQVQSDGSCPDPSEVSRNVQAIAELSETSAADLRATLRRDGAWLKLELAHVDGASLGERRIETTEDCATLARAAAVVIATWLSNEHPEFLSALPSEPTPLPMAPAPVEAAPPPPPPPPIVSAKPAPVAPSPPKTVRRFVLGASIGGSGARSDFAPAAALSVAYGPEQAGLGVRLGLTWTGNHSQPLGDHSVSWTRWPLTLGPYWSIVRGSSRLELEAGPALGWLRLEGRDFEQNFGYGSALFGGYGQIRFVPKLGKLAGFISLTPHYWFGRSTARVTAPDGSVTTTADLPAFELLLTGGMQLAL